MRKHFGTLLNVCVMISFILSLANVQPVVAQPTVPHKDAIVENAVEPVELTDEAALEKIDPLLRETVDAGGKDLIDVYVSVMGDVDLTPYLTQIINRPVVFAGIHNVYGKTTASQLLSIAKNDNVVAVVSTRTEMRDKPYDPIRAEESGTTSVNQMSLATAASKDATTQGWFDVQDGHKSKTAWGKGFTGEGVIVGVLDDGIDFAHPDLQGTYAWVTDPASPYYGWPMSFSQRSVLYYAYDVLYGTSYISDGWGGSRWVDTSTELTATNGTVSYQPTDATSAHTYTIPETSLSGTYKIGSLPEQNLWDLFGEMVAVLVVDEHTVGVYDTVYVDLNHNYDFTDELPANKESPEVYNDLTGDGLADISGGLISWISDGTNTPPTVDWLWDITCGDEVGALKACPDSGALVIFAGAFDSGYTHGTQCASNVAGQGVVSDGLSAQPFQVGGSVQGAAPNVGLMDFGNHYYDGTDEDEFLVAALGYDGIPNSGDEVQITSNSYGSFTQMWGGWGYIGRLVTALNMSIAPTTVWVFSAGNEGPGFGPQEGENSPTIIKAGSSTQYGSTNWDSIQDPDQIIYGDPSLFYSHGPNRDGSSGVDLLGNGGRGAGDEGLNYFAIDRGMVWDGASSWDTWGGTSRSAPVLAGNLALVYQAYRARFGEWPTWDVVKAIAKSSATNVVSSPFFQGGGVMDSDRATDVAAGIYGVFATPDEWMVGNWQGEEYLAFSNVAEAGQSYSKTYTVTNPSDYDITVDLKDGVMMKQVGSYEFEFTTSDLGQESAYNFNAPNYLVKMDASKIPSDSEVMIVRYIQPYSSFDTEPNYSASDIDNSWRFMVYNWKDQNGDGNLWVDKDTNGTVAYSGNGQYTNDGFEMVDYADPATEIQEGEYIRMDYGFGGIGVPVIIHDPLSRMQDGYFFGLQHRSTRDTNVRTTTFKIGVEFYKLSDWQWLDLNKTSLAVPAGSQASFDASMDIPADTAPGIYEGVILLTDPGDGRHSAHESALPVVVNIIADLPDDGMVTLGGQPMENTMYQNSWTHGYFNWYGGGWTGAGDWRHYFLNISEEDVASKNLLVHTSWQYVPTDINTWVLGPTEDCASNGVEPCALYSSIVGQPDQGIFGPYTLQPITSSAGGFLSGATYPFNTSTGGPDDWILAPLSRAGLHEIALHNVVYAGEDLAEQFKVDIGTLKFDFNMDPAYGLADASSMTISSLVNAGSVDLNFTPTLSLPDLQANLSGGLTATGFGPYNTTVIDNGGNFSAWNANNTYEPFVVDQTGATELVVTLNTPSGQDPDMFLVYDSDDNGVAEAAHDIVVGSSGNSTGTPEEITVTAPELGRYFMVIAGYSITPTTGIDITWQYQVTAPGSLPMEPVDAFNGTVNITDDEDTFDPTLAGIYQTSFTTNERVAALHIDLTGIPDGNDIDLYVTDEAGNIIAQSTNALNVDEGITIAATSPQYRLQPGDEYTIFLHGKDVTGEITPNLHIWFDQLNLWLSSTQSDVSVLAIGPGETDPTGTFVLNYDNTTWLAGDFMSARITAGPSVLSSAFDELVTINRINALSDLAQFDVSMVVTSSRGPSPMAYNSPAGYPPNPSAALAAPGEDLTYTVMMINNGLAEGDAVADIYWIDARYDFVEFVGVQPTVYNSGISGSVEWLDVYATVGPGESYEFSYKLKSISATPVNASYVDIFPAPYTAASGSDLAISHYLDFSNSLLSAYSSKRADKLSVGQSENFVYTISLTNPSAVDKQVYVSDVLPTEVDYVNSPDMAYDPATRTLTWDGVLPGSSNAQTNLTITVATPLDVLNDITIINNADVALTEGGDSIATLTSVVKTSVEPDLVVEKSVSKLSALPGETLTYTISVTNNGPASAQNVQLYDYLPSEVNLEVGSVSGATINSDVLTWEDDLPIGATHTVTYDATIKSETPVNWVIIGKAEALSENYPKSFDTALTQIVGTSIMAAFSAPRYETYPADQAVMDLVIEIGAADTYSSDVLTDTLISFIAPNGVDLNGVEVEAFTVSGANENSLGTLTLTTGQKSMWISQFSNAGERASLSSIAGETIIYRLKFTTDGTMSGLYEFTGQTVAATAWNFSNVTSWVVPSNQAKTNLFIYYVLSLPIIER